MREVFDEPPVEISKTEERLYFSFIGWFQPVCHTCYFHRVHLDLVFGDNQSEVLYPGLLKLTLFGLKIQLVFRQSPEYPVGDPPMFIQVLCED